MYISISTWYHEYINNDKNPRSIRAEWKCSKMKKVGRRRWEDGEDVGFIYYSNSTARCEDGQETGSVCYSRYYSIHHIHSFCLLSCSSVTNIFKSTSFALSQTFAIHGCSLPRLSY